MTFVELAEDVLKTAERPLTYKEIWEIAISKGLDKKVGSKGKTPYVYFGSKNLCGYEREKRFGVLYCL